MFHPRRKRRSPSCAGARLLVINSDHPGNRGFGRSSPATPAQRGGEITGPRALSIPELTSLVCPRTQRRAGLWFKTK